MLYGTVRKEMESFFGDDGNEIAHALEVTSHALQIQAVEGGDRDVVTMAALLHDVGIKPAKERFGSGAGHYQEKLGPLVLLRCPPLPRRAANSPRLIHVKVR